MKRFTALPCFVIILALLTAQVGAAFASSEMINMVEMRENSTAYAPSQVGEQTTNASNAHKDCDMQLSFDESANESSITSVNETTHTKPSINADCCKTSDGVSCCEIQCHCVALSGSLVFLGGSLFEEATSISCPLLVQYNKRLLAPHTTTPKRPPITTFS